MRWPSSRRPDCRGGALGETKSIQRQHPAPDRRRVALAGNDILRRHAVPAGENGAASGTLDRAPRSRAQKGRKSMRTCKPISAKGSFLDLAAQTVSLGADHSERPAIALVRV